LSGIFGAVDVAKSGDFLRRLLWPAGASTTAINLFPLACRLIKSNIILVPRFLNISFVLLSLLLILVTTGIDKVTIFLLALL
jgi:hypothetical protein